MTRRRRFTAADHGRANALAAARVDGFLPPAEAAWLSGHLDACPPCAAIAADYEAQHDLFSGLRSAAPVPPRDLWARTAAALDAERGRRSGSWRHLRRTPHQTLGPVVALRRATARQALVPVVALLSLVLIVGAGLLNGRLGWPGIAAAPTPIALTADQVQMLGRDSAGHLTLLNRTIDHVCPNGGDACGASPTFAVTGLSDLTAGVALQAAISPTGGQMVVVAQGPGGQGVYIVPVKTPTPSGTPAGSRPPESSTRATPALVSTEPSPTASGSTRPTASPPVGASASLETPRHQSPTTTPESPSVTPATASQSPGASSSEEASESPQGSPAASPDGSSSVVPGSAGPSDSSAEPTPMSSFDVTPAPSGALKIASDVTVVGGPVYAPDGVRLAFAAMPSDGSAGPDVYVWDGGDTTAQAITGDHDSWLAGWTRDGILVSRVQDGTPSTFQLDSDSGVATPIGTPGMWLPAVSPDGLSAAWWSGSVKLASDGATWVPDAGLLVIGPWPNNGAPEGLHILARDRISAWHVRWNDDGSAVAVWVDPVGDGRSGQLSLYSADATAGPDFANPMLNAAPANPDFSLRNGRLVWTTPSQGAPEQVEILAWSGKTVVTFEVPAQGSGTVVP